MSPPPLAVQEPDITALLAAASEGDPQAVDRLYPVVYDALKAIARRQLRGERDDHTLSPTALVHEAYLKLVDRLSVTWEGRGQFYSVASNAMRRILVDHARRRTAAKRGRQHQVTLDPDTPATTPDPADEIIAVDDALKELAIEDPRSARLVELRYFGGLTIEEAANALDVSVATAKRDWVLARAWLQRALG